jgi:hypothetical protein
VRSIVHIPVPLRKLYIRFVHVGSLPKYHYFLKGLFNLLHELRGLQVIESRSCSGQPLQSHLTRFLTPYFALFLMSAFLKTSLSYYDYVGTISSHEPDAGKGVFLPLLILDVVVLKAIFCSENDSIQDVR